MNLNRSGFVAAVPHEDPDIRFAVRAALAGVRLLPSDRVTEIRTPAKGRVRARKVVTRARWRQTGKFISQKCEHLPQTESPAERAGHRLLEADPTVSHFREQPFEIKYVLNGKIRSHYPDALAERVNGSREVWEIKEAFDAFQSDVLARTALMSRDLVAFGFHYRLVLAEDLLRQPRLKNLTEVLRLSRHPVDAATREHVRQLAVNANGIPWVAATEGLLGDRGPQVLCTLFTEGLLTFDLDLPLSPSTRFRLCSAPEEIQP